MTLFFSLSTAAQADWDPGTSTVVDGVGSTGGHADLEFVIATHQIVDPIKMNGMTYIDESTRSVRYAHRSTSLGSALANAPWSVQELSPNGGEPGDEISWPNLAMDPVTGRAYVAFRWITDGEWDSWLSTYVGSGAGNCGTSNDWLCENIDEICGLSESYVSPRVELGGVFAAESDTVHILHINPQLIDIRKDLGTGQWTCDPVANSSPGGLFHDSAVRRHVYDDRLKPQLLHSTMSDSTYIRSLIAPRATAPWSLEKLAADSTWFLPSLTRIDHGLSDVPPNISGYGDPAFVSVNPNYTAINNHRITCTDGTPGNPTWELRYQVSGNDAGTSWAPPEQIVVGEPCEPTMDVGWNGDPYVAYIDQTTGDVALTTRRPGPGWLPSSPVAPDAAAPSLAYDYDDGSIAIAYQDVLDLDVIVADGSWTD